LIGVIGENELTLRGKIFIEGKLIKEDISVNPDESLSFRDKLEQCLIDICSKLDTPVPLWLKKNTKELAIFHRTFFTREQFVEKVWFDKLEIILG
jgi:hypothetical protein